MILLGVILGVYFHPSHGVAVGISIACAAMILFHEMLENLSGHPDSLVDRALPRPVGTANRIANGDGTAPGALLVGGAYYTRRA